MDEEEIEIADEIVIGERLVTESSESENEHDTNDNDITQESEKGKGS